MICCYFVSPFQGEFGQVFTLVAQVDLLFCELPFYCQIVSSKCSLYIRIVILCPLHLNVFLPMCCQFTGFVYGIFSYLKMFTQLNMSVLCKERYKDFLGVLLFFFIYMLILLNIFFINGQISVQFYHLLNGQLANCASTILLNKPSFSH